MKVQLPITHIEEIDIPDKVFWQYIKEQFKKKYPAYHQDTWIDDEGEMRIPREWDSSGKYYLTGDEKFRMLAIHGIWQQIREIYEPPYGSR